MNNFRVWNVPKVVPLVHCVWSLRGSWDAGRVIKVIIKSGCKQVLLCYRWTCDWVQGWHYMV